MGVKEEHMPLWRPYLPMGGNTIEQLQDAKVILWNGFCSVHKRFTVDQITKARADYDNVQVIVHPECPAPVVEAADGVGSTEYIRKAIEAGKPGDVFAVGTEINLVNRLQAQHPEIDRKSTRLNSSHVAISYAVFCLKKKKTTQTIPSKLT